MAVPFHEMMHDKIWTWIREFSNSPTAQYATNPSAIVILEGVIESIPHEHPPDHPESVWPAFVGGHNYGSGTIQEIFSFSEQMCTVAEFLHRDGLQQRISWYDMKRILKFYISDSKGYIEYINSLGWNNDRLNSYFDLNLNDLNFPGLGVNHPIMVNQLIWSRYLSGTKIFHPTENQQNYGETFVIELLARGEEYWGPRVSEDIFGIQGDVYFYNPEEQEEEQHEEPSKKKEALKKIQSIVDEVSGDIGDGAYLKLMDVLKGEWS